MKCIQTWRKSDGIVYRKYTNDAGKVATTYEVDSSMVNLADLQALIRKAKGRRNLKPTEKGIRLPKDKIDAVLTELQLGRTHRDIAARQNVSTKSIQRIKREFKNDY